MDRSLVQAKQGRSSPEMGAKPEAGLNPAVGNTIEPGLAKLTARRVTCRDISRRSSECVRPWRAGIAKPHAGYVGCISRAGGRSIPTCRGSADPIAGPMNLVRRNSRLETADALRDRLHGRPLVNRATTNKDLRRSFTR
jgi:hypothetical protein